MPPRPRVRDVWNGHVGAVQTPRTREERTESDCLSDQFSTLMERGASLSHQLNLRARDVQRALDWLAQLSLPMWFQA